MAEENNDKAKGAKPELTPEQEAEIAAKKQARAEAKAKGVKAGKGKAAAAAKEVAMERVKREQPARLRKLYETEVKQRLRQEFGVGDHHRQPVVQLGQPLHRGAGLSSHPAPPASVGHTLGACGWRERDRSVESRWRIPVEELASWAADRRRRIWRARRVLACIWASRHRVASRMAGQ